MNDFPFGKKHFLFHRNLDSFNFPSSLHGMVILGGCQCASHQLQTRPHSAGTEFLEGFFLKDEDVESDM